MSTESAVRSALRSQLLSNVDSAKGIVDEFWVPRSHERADLVAVGSSFDGFEIKTERDTLQRLPRQASAYGRLFDHCTLVVAANHLNDAEGIIPKWWGITVIRSGETPDFELYRSAQANPAIDPEILVRLLWRNDAAQALTNLGFVPDPQASRGALWKELLERVSLTNLRSTVRLAILNRDPSLARIPTRRFAAK
jgi:hypothetical protein